jgi:hypothetical protein
MILKGLLKIELLISNYKAMKAILGCIILATIMVWAVSAQVLQYDGYI